MDRDETERLLKSTDVANGTFLVRESNSTKGWVISSNECNIAMTQVDLFRV